MTVFRFVISPHHKQNEAHKNTNLKVAAMSSGVPVSLGKPSLRLRLEAYYSLIDPKRLQDGKKWREVYEEIWKKYGGSYGGERKLSLKLAMKYGSRVKLLLAEAMDSNHQNTKSPSFDESWYAVPPKKSGVIEFCSVQFDAVCLLDSSEGKNKSPNV